MESIGIIDYYLDEWHANNYPEMIRNLSRGEVQIRLAWAKRDSDHGLTNSQWSEKYQVALAVSGEEVAQK